MAKMVVNKRWSYADDRRLIQLAASSKSVKAIADEMNRPPERVTQMALRLGISLKSATKPKASQMSRSRPAQRPWTADEQEKFDDLLRAGKDAGDWKIVAEGGVRDLRGAFVRPFLPSTSGCAWM
jgi:hypothetical protein